MPALGSALATRSPHEHRASQPQDRAPSRVLPAPTTCTHLTRPALCSLPPRTPHNARTPAPPQKKGGKTKKQTLRFTIDCSVLVDDGLLDTASFEKFLRDRIKVNGKAGMLGDAVTLTRDKAKIFVSSEVPFSKRYLKYLTKKYLKRFHLRDFFHVIASNKQTYQVRYFKIGDSGDAEGAAADE